MFGAQALQPGESGTWLGKYELLRKIAVGGMAELYVARVTGMHGFEKLVALKKVHETHHGNHEFIQMLMDEARLAANLDHPNIAPVYDFGRDGTTYFFTMEYVRGKDLRQLVRAVQAREQRVPLNHILTIATGVAAGLHYAHELCGQDGKPLGVVHRDVSPSNVLVTYDGGVKLVDFGIAKAAALNPHDSADGTLKGKISYMSPEQVRGGALDRRSDVYALGIILWELATHSRLYRGGEYEVLQTIANRDAPRPSTVDPSFPPGLEDIIMKALERDPERRYASAEALQLALEDFAREHRYSLSSAKLAKYMREVFCQQIAAERSQLMEASGLLQLEQATEAECPPTMQLSREEIAAVSSSQLAQPSQELEFDSVDIPQDDAGKTHEEPVVFGLRPRRVRGVVLGTLIVCTVALASWGAWVFSTQPPLEVLEAAPAPAPPPTEAAKSPPAKQLRSPAPAPRPTPQTAAKTSQQAPEEPASEQTPAPADPAQSQDDKKSAPQSVAKPSRRSDKPRRPKTTKNITKTWDPDSPLPPM